MAGPQNELQVAIAMIGIHYDPRPYRDPHAMADRENPPALGPRLHHLRKERGLTLDGLSAASGVSRSMLSQIERGQANPTLAIMWYLSQALGVELSEFVGGKRVERRGRIELTAASFVPEIRTEDGQAITESRRAASSILTCRSDSSAIFVRWETVIYSGIPS